MNTVNSVGYADVGADITAQANALGRDRRVFCERRDGHWVFYRLMVGSGFKRAVVIGKTSRAALVIKKMRGFL